MMVLKEYDEIGKAICNKLYFFTPITSVNDRYLISTYGEIFDIIENKNVIKNIMYLYKNDGKQNFSIETLIVELEHKTYGKNHYFIPALMYLEFYKPINTIIEIEDLIVLQNDMEVPYINLYNMKFKKELEEVEKLVPKMVKCGNICYNIITDKEDIKSSLKNRYTFGIYLNNPIFNLPKDRYIGLTNLKVYDTIKEEFVEIKILNLHEYGSIPDPTEYIRYGHLVTKDNSLVPLNLNVLLYSNFHNLEKHLSIHTTVAQCEKEDTIYGLKVVSCTNSKPIEKDSLITKIKKFFSNFFE